MDIVYEVELQKNQETIEVFFIRSVPLSTRKKKRKRMKKNKSLHSTNYFNTFIEVAEDCPVDIGTVPPMRSDKLTVAGYQYEILRNAPYQYTSDDVFFRVFAMRNDLSEPEWPEARAEFFSKGQPCFRASPLTKRFGWGVHCDEAGKLALYGMETLAYAEMLQRQDLKVVRAMRAKR